MLYKDEYEYFKQELLEDTEKPYSMSNAELAQEYFAEIKKEYPTASMYSFGITQFICVTNKARARFADMLKAKELKLIEQQTAITGLLNNVTWDMLGGKQ